MPNRMHREHGYDHQYPLGAIVLCQHGAGVVTGVRVRADLHAVVYWFTPDGDPKERVIFEHEIIGYCTNVERNRTQTERIPGL